MTTLSNIEVSHKSSTESSKNPNNTHTVHRQETKDNIIQVSNGFKDDSNRNPRNETSSDLIFNINRPNPTLSTGHLDIFNNKSQNVMDNDNNRGVSIGSKSPKVTSKKLIKVKIVKRKKSVEVINQELIEKEKSLEIKPLINRAIDTLRDCQGCIKSYIKYGDKALSVTNNTSLNLEQQFIRIKMSLNYTQEMSHRINLEKLESTIALLMLLSKDFKNCILDKSSEQELKQIKDDNEILYEHCAELEYEIKDKMNSRLKQMYWGIPEMINNDQRDVRHSELQAKYSQYLRRDITNSRIKKLADILSYLPKRKLQFYTSRDANIKKLQEENKWLERELERLNDNTRDELARKNNVMLEKMKEIEALKRENFGLKENLFELQGQVKQKDEEISSLKSELLYAKNRLNKLIEDARIKDQVFVEKMGEMKQTIEELMKEKAEKQNQIIKLNEKCADLEKRLAEALANHENALKDVEELKKQNEELKEQIKKFIDANSADGFKALLSLANMIIARTKRPPPISTRDKQLIKDIFDTNTKAMLDEISKLQEEGKLYREELRKMVAQKGIYQSKLKEIIQVLFFCCFHLEYGSFK